MVLLKAMDAATLEKATEEELLRACRYSAVERLAPRVYAVVSSLLTLALVVVVGAYTFKDGYLGVGPLLVGAMMIFVLLGLGIFLLLGGTAYLVERPEDRIDRPRKALLERYGQLGIDEGVRLALQEARDAAPDYTIFLSGQEMPGDRCYWVRLDVDQAGQARVEYRVGPRIDLQNDPDPLPRVVRARAALEPGEGAELMSFLADLGQGSLRSVKSCFINGMPCEVALLRRGSDGVARGGCNYVAQDDRVETEGVMQLVGMILTLVRARLPDNGGPR